MGRGLDETMAAADRALYRAKRLGRNRVEPEALAA
jgi:PleD family two-component response regulator